jgi:hypothetical protein
MTIVSEIGFPWPIFHWTLFLPVCSVRHSVCHFLPNFPFFSMAAKKATAKKTTAPAKKVAVKAAKVVNFPIRSPRVKVCGIAVFARLVDKVRLEDEGKLPAGYQLGPVKGKRTFDDRFCRFLQISFGDFQERVLAGGEDEEILRDLFEIGVEPDAEQIEVWNTFMEKRGWRDSASAGLEEQKVEAGFADREDIQTFFDLMDAEEGH